MMPTNFNNDKFSPSNMLVFQVDCAEYKRNSKLSYFSIPFTGHIFSEKKVCVPKTKLHHHCVICVYHHHIYLMAPMNQSSSYVSIIIHTIL